MIFEVFDVIVDKGEFGKIDFGRAGVVVVLEPVAARVFASSFLLSFVSVLRACLGSDMGTILLYWRLLVSLAGPWVGKPCGVYEPSLANCTEVL